MTHYINDVGGGKKGSGGMKEDDGKTTLCEDDSGLTRQKRQIEMYLETRGGHDHAVS